MFQMRFIRYFISLTSIYVLPPHIIQTWHAKKTRKFSLNNSVDQNIDRFSFLFRDVMSVFWNAFNAGNKLCMVRSNSAIGTKTGKPLMKSFQPIHKLQLKKTFLPSSIKFILYFFYLVIKLVFLLIGLNASKAKEKLKHWDGGTERNVAYPVIRN